MQGYSLFIIFVKTLFSTWKNANTYKNLCTKREKWTSGHYLNKDYLKTEIILNK
jgi:hypothetical protein